MAKNDLNEVSESVQLATEELEEKYIYRKNILTSEQEL